MAVSLHNFLKKKAFQAERDALDAIDAILIQENHILDRKREDRLEVNHRSIVIYSWGFDSAEVLRKQAHILRSLEAEGLVVKDHGFFQDGTGMGHLEGVIEISAKANGGFEAICSKLAHRMAIPAHAMMQHKVA